METRHTHGLNASQSETTTQPIPTQLFEDQNGEPYSARSIQTFFKDTLKQAGITKNTTIHTLRHSFDTHHIENVTILCYIQQLHGYPTNKTNVA